MCVSLYFTRSIFFHSYCCCRRLRIQCKSCISNVLIMPFYMRAYNSLSTAEFAYPLNIYIFPNWNWMLVDDSMPILSLMYVCAIWNAFYCVWCVVYGDASIAIHAHTFIGNKTEWNVCVRIVVFKKIFRCICFDCCSSWPIEGENI